MIAFIDLDNFKLINDRFGHNSGDLFLIQVGERLNTLQQNGEVIGRLAGDEFLVVSLNNETGGYFVAARTYSTANTWRISLR